MFFLYVIDNEFESLVLFLFYYDLYKDLMLLDIDQYSKNCFVFMLLFEDKKGFFLRILGKKQYFNVIFFVSKILILDEQN